VICRGCKSLVLDPGDWIEGFTIAIHRGVEGLRVSGPIIIYLRRLSSSSSTMVAAQATSTMSAASL